MKENPLIQAVITDNVEMVQRLLQSGMDPNVSEDADKITPLHFVAQRDSPAALIIARLLMRAGADPLALTEPDGQTPLEVARLMSNEKMVAILSGVDEDSQVLH